MPEVEKRRELKGPRDAFLYLLNFVALYMSAIGVLILAWGLIDVAFVDPLRVLRETNTVRVGISMVVVSFPVFLYIARNIRRRLTSGDMPSESLLRRVLTYLSLFVIAITAVVDLILVIYNFLGGDLSAKFALRALSVLLVAGMTFWYYLLEVAEQKESRAPSSAVAKEA